jgi:hypothetical protein
MTSKTVGSVAKDISAKLPIFTAKGGLLIALPLEHALRAVLLDRSSFDAERFYVHVFVQLLCIPFPHIFLDVGWRVGGGAHAWSRSDPDLIEKLTRALAGEPCRFLAPIQSPEDVAAAALSLHAPRNLGVQQTVAFAFARAGDYGRAVVEMGALLDLLGDRPGWEREMAQQTRQLIAQLTGEPEAVTRQLDLWEEETARALRVNQFRVTKV